MKRTGVVTSHTVRINDEQLTFELTRKAVKRINLRVVKDGTVKVSAAPRVPLHRIEAFVIAEADFIRRARAQLAMAAIKRPDPFRYRNGDIFTVLGTSVTLRIQRVSAPKEEGCYYDTASGEVWLYIVADADEVHRRRILERFWRELGKKTFPPLLMTALEAMRQQGYKGPVPELRMRRMKSRWGSCMPSRPWITMNTRLLEGPREYIYYVMVHEAAHLLRADHSPVFHALVAHELPQWPMLKKALNDYFRNKPML